MVAFIGQSFAQVDVEFGTMEGRPRHIDFKLMQDGKKVPYYGLKAEDCVCYELISGDTVAMNIDSLINISNKKLVSNNLTIVILADQGSELDEAEYKTLLGSMVSFVEALPDYVKVYISMMGNSQTGVTMTHRVKGRSDIEAFVRSDDVAERSGDAKKYLYGSIISKIQEIGNVPVEDCYYFYDFDTIMPHNEELSNDTISDKILFVLSGKVDNSDDENFFRDKFLLHSDGYLTIPKQLKAIYCIYFGDETDAETLGELAFISKSTPEGRFYSKFAVDSVKSVLLGAIDSIAMDYRLFYSVGEKVTYNGQPVELNLDIQKANAHGVKEYSIGNALNPITLNPSEGGGRGNMRSRFFLNILYGLLVGIGVIAAMYGIMQFLVPWLQYKLFKKKYVKKFKASDVQTEGDDVVLEQCYYCKDNFQEGDLIVTKCKHTVHWECWEENHDRCPEYGLNSCKEGIYFYDKKHLADERNSPYFTSWLLYGLAGGLISWVLFKFFTFLQFSLHIDRCGGFLGYLPKLLASLIQGEDVACAYVSKIKPLLLCGLILGFVITFLFSYLIEFRKKTAKTILLMLARSAGNAVIGCLAFLLGSVVIIALGKSSNCWWIDWVPWLFFGIAIPWLISLKSDIGFKQAFIGGLVSAVFSFVAIYGLGASQVVGALAFMIYAAGLGASIAVVHYVSENYFLHIEGPTKERDIAIYKWMNVAGGSNHVTIGSSINCVIQMNWDNSDQIQEKQVELYIDNDHPYCMALTDGTVYGNDNKPLKAGDSFMLTHGSHFTIGNTKFTYIEKDK